MLRSRRPAFPLVKITRLSFARFHLLIDRFIVEFYFQEVRRIRQFDMKIMQRIDLNSARSEVGNPEHAAPFLVLSEKVKMEAGDTYALRVRRGSRAGQRALHISKNIFRLMRCRLGERRKWPMLMANAPHANPIENIVDSQCCEKIRVRYILEKREEISFRDIVRQVQLLFRLKEC